MKSLKNIKGNLFGGITAGVVALPLALAFGEASGAGAIAGLWGAILVGFFAALFGGTGSQVSGPTGPMVVVFAGIYTAAAGDPNIVFAAVMLGGLLMILFGVLRMGQYIRLVPYPVISGFMSGIGCIIIILQFVRLFGHEPSGTGTINALIAIPGAISSPVWIALGLSVMTLFIVFFWPKTLAVYLPAPLAALIIGTTVSAIFPGAPVIGDIPTGFPSFVLPAFTGATFAMVLEAAFLLALLGAIDSLLTSLVADNMTRTRHNSNKELIGQGIGNTIAGLFGGVPGAGATMRTVVNIRTGGSTRLSGMTHSLLLLAVVLSLGPLASQIPHAVLAGILVKVGYDIVDWNYLMRAHTGPRWDLVLMLLVLVLTVVVDLITAVAAGVVLAALAFVKQVADIQLKTLRTEESMLSSLKEKKLLGKMSNRVTLFSFSGPLSFGAAADFAHHVRMRSEDRDILVIDFEAVPTLDISAVMAVETVAIDVNNSGRQLYIAGANEYIRKVLEDLGFEKFLPENHWFETRLEALAYAESHIDEE